MHFSQKENNNIWKIVPTYGVKRKKNGTYVDN